MSTHEYAFDTGNQVLGGIRTSEKDARGTLVLLHGAGNDHHALARLASLVTALDVVALDLPGRGRSTGAPLTSVREAADVVARIAMDPALKGPMLVGGHSLGGGIALEMALEQPVPGLVLLSTGARLRVRPELLDEIRATAEGERPRARGLGFHADTDRTLVAELDRAFDAIPGETALADWRMANDFDRLFDVSRISAPTLVVHGDDDPFTPFKYAEHLARVIPKAELVHLRGGTHMAVVERAAEVARAIDDFARALLP